MTDARFEDVAFSDRPLRLTIANTEDVPVVSSLVQDAVGLVGEISWMPRRRRLAALVNRFRWEDREAAERAGRRFERVRTALVFDGVEAVRANGIDPAEKDMVYSVLQMRFEAEEDGAGRIVLDLAGDGMLEMVVECLDGRLVDLTRPWVANAKSAPDHGA